MNVFFPNSDPLSLGAEAVETELLTRQLQQARLRRDICRACLNGFGIGPSLTACAETLVRSLRVSSAGIWMLADGETLQLQGAAGLLCDEEQYAGLRRVAVRDDTPVGRVAARGASVVIEELADSDLKAPDAVSAPAGLAFAGVPIVQDGRCTGVLAVIHQAPLGERLARTLEAAAEETVFAYPRMTAEEDRAKRLRLGRVLLRSSPLAVVGLDDRKRVTTWNAGAGQLFGWPADDVTGRRIPFLAQADSERFEIFFREALRGRRTTHFELWAQRWNGRKVPVSVSAVPLLDHGGASDQVVLIISDRSSLAAAEKRLQAQLAVASVTSGCDSIELAAPRLLQAVGENLGFKCGEFWQADAESDSWNRLALRPAGAASRETGESTTLEIRLDDDILGLARRMRKILWLQNLSRSSVTPRASALAQCGLHDALAVPVLVESQVAAVMVFFDFEIAAPDEATRTTLEGVASQVGQFLARVRTTAALRAAEESHRQSQKMEAVGLLAGGIAHDFNNILTIILGHSELTREMLDDDSPLRPLVTEIEKAGQRAAALTRQLLAFSRKQVLEPVVLDLGARVRDMESMLRRLAGEDVRLETSLADDLHPVRVDPAQVEQVLLNLVVNARDAMPDGGQLTVRTKNVAVAPREAKEHPDARPGDYAALIVSDTGCGMDAQTRARIFEPFFTTKEQGKGTGMGLSTVFGIVKQSDGFITVDSRPGEGTTFSVLLPRTRQSLLPMQVESEMPEQPGGSETILLAEDEDVVRALTVRLLEARGYTVLPAADGNDALQALQRHDGRVDLLLTDVMMPGMSGPALAARVAALQPGVKTLFMSGYTESDVLHREVLEPGRPLLHKPFASDALAGKVRQALDG